MPGAPTVHVSGYPVCGYHVRLQRQLAWVQRAAELYDMGLNSPGTSYCAIKVRSSAEVAARGGGHVQESIEALQHVAVQPQP